MRRFSRLMIAFSRKVENHAAEVALYVYYYNFIKPHRSLKNATPAMAAGLASWRKKVEDIVRLLDRDYERSRPKRRGPYKKSVKAADGALNAARS